MQVGICGPIRDAVLSILAEQEDWHECWTFFEEYTCENRSPKTYVLIMRAAVRCKRGSEAADIYRFSAAPLPISTRLSPCPESRLRLAIPRVWFALCRCSDLKDDVGNSSCMMPPVLTELLVAALCSSGMAVEAMDVMKEHCDRDSEQRKRCELVYAHLTTRD